MKIQSIKFQLSKETIKHIENSTRCSIEELRTLSLAETKDLMIKAGVQIKIPKERCQQIIDEIESICREKLVVNI